MSKLLNSHRFHHLIFDKFLLVLTTLSFVFLFEYSFSTFIINNFDYFGFRETQLDFLNVLLIKITLVVNTLILPLQVRRPSQFLNLFLYLFIYLPSSIVLFSVRTDWLPVSDAFNMFFVFSFSMLVISLSSRLPRMNVKNIKIQRSSFIIINYIVFFLFCFLFSKSLTNFKFVGISQLALLNESRQSQPISGLFIYFYLWIITFFIGLFLSEYSRLSIRVKFTLVGLVYFLFAFSMGAKILLVAPFVFLFVLLWLNYFNRKTYLFFLPFVLLFIVINVVSSFFPEIGFAINALFTFRTLSISSLSFVIYFDYFNTHEFTYFQHVGLVNNITGLFSDNLKDFVPLPVVLAEEYGLGNFNASFFVNDGYASLGYAGILLVTILFSIIMYILDSIAKPIKLSTICLSLTYFGMYLGNISLFTLLVSHGLILLLFYFYAFSKYLNAEI